MAKGHSQKTLARKYAFKFLYQKALNELDAKTPTEELEAQMDDFEESYTKPDEEHEDNELGHETRFFGRRLVIDCFRENEVIKQLLAPALGTRSLEKLDCLERTIIVLGATEMYTRKDTPTPVVINEYVEMAKEYGNEKSYTFVNGVLDNLSKAIR